MGELGEFGSNMVTEVERRPLVGLSCVFRLAVLMGGGERGSWGTWIFIIIGGGILIIGEYLALFSRLVFLSEIS